MNDFYLINEIAGEAAMNLIHMESMPSDVEIYREAVHCAHAVEEIEDASIYCEEHMHEIIDTVRDKWLEYNGEDVETEDDEYLDYEQYE